MCEQATDGRLGSVIQGRYRLKSFLARGGMGSVFLCDDLRLSGQKWAIKEMLSAHPLETSLLQESFRREAEMLARLRHPSLPAIVDSFMDGNRHYLVMEYIAGTTLGRHIEESGPVSHEQSLQWGLELAEVLDYLHAQSPPVIFRDLKPDNVLVAEGKRLKLVDFGLARHFRPGKSRDTQAAGSIGYSPPEQWEDREQTDQRSDIYGWGAVMHFLLSGKPPSATYGQQKLNQLRPDLDTRMDSLILKCLEPDPGLRYQNCGELIRRLRELRGGSARPTAPSPRPMPLPGMLAALLLMALGWVAWARRPAPVLPEPLQLREILAQTAPLKAKLRHRPLEQSIGPLQKLTHDYPLDGKAQILLGNALALQSRRPLFHIPVVSSISGSEYEGMQMLVGLALAQRELNQIGVRNARHPEAGPGQIVLDFINCESRQDLTLEAYLKVASDQKYALGIGPWSSQQMLAVAPIVESAGFPTIAPTVSDPRTNHLGPNCLTVADSDDGRVNALAKFFAESGLKRAVILSNEENVVGHSSANRFRREFTALGGTVVAELGYLQNTLDYSAQLDRLGQVRADCLFMPDYRAGVVRSVVRLLRARGSKLRVGSLAAIYSGAALNEGRPLEGLVVCSYFFAQAPSPQVQDFVMRYQKFTDSPTPSHREAYSYDCLNLIARAIGEVGFERSRLREYLNALGKSLPAYRGVSGEFSPSRQKETRHAYILEMREGKLQVLR